MRRDWRKQSGNISIGRYKCIESTYNMAGLGEPAKYDYCLCGRYGQIWKEPDGSLFVIVRSKKIQNKLISELSLDLKPGPHPYDELIIRTSLDHLDTLVTTLRVPKSPATQVRLANEA